MNNYTFIHMKDLLGKISPTKTLLLCVGLVYLLVILLSVPVSVHALEVDDSDPTTEELIRRGIYYYDPGYEACTTEAGDTFATEDTIYVLGDSITKGIKTDLAGKLTAKNYTDIFINGVNGRSVAGAGSGDETGLQAIENDKDKIKESSSVVIQLGTNGGTNKKNINKMIDNIKKINERANIYWVNVGVTRNDLSKTQEEANKALDNNAKKDAYTVIDWQKKIGNNDPDNLLGDKVHPNSKGSKVLANLIANKATVASINPENGKVTGVGKDKSVAAKVWAFLVTKGEISVMGVKVQGLGLNDAAAAGVMGNLEEESGFDASIVERVPSHAGAGYGLAQWTGPRRIALENFAKSEGEKASHLGLQLKFFRKELNEGYKNTLKQLKNTNDVKKATWIFHGSTPNSGIPSPYGGGFERSNDNPAQIQERVDQAKKYLNKYGNGNVSVGNNPDCEEGEGDGVATGDFIWPLKGSIKDIGSDTGMRIQPTGPRKGESICHTGADIGKPAGTKIKAADGGVVLSSQSEAESGGWGNFIVIKHSKNLNTEYAHMLSKSPLKTGDKVSQGDAVGKVGSTGQSTGPHLHYNVKYKGAPMSVTAWYNGTIKKAC